MFKVFNNSTHIAAIKSTGNMFSYEAIEELNIKPKSFRDLLTDEPYQRKDLIIVQDPALTDKFNLNSFHHIKNKLKVDDEGNKFVNAHVLWQYRLWSFKNVDNLKSLICINPRTPNSVHV